jgi:hypothetical protein
LLGRDRAPVNVREELISAVAKRMTMRPGTRKTASWFTLTLLGTAGALGGASALGASTESPPNRFEFSDTEVGCALTLEIEGQDLRITNARVDQDPVNCDISVEFTYKMFGWVTSDGRGDALPCPEGTVRSSPVGTAGAYAEFGHGGVNAFVAGCASAGLVLVDA